MASGRTPWSPAVCLTGMLGDDVTLRQKIGARWPLVQPALPVTVPADLPMLLYLTNIGLALKKI